MTERAALVYLLRNGKKWKQLTDLVKLSQSALAVLHRNFSDLPGVVPDPKAIPSVPSKDALEAVEFEIRAWEATGCRLVTILDLDYPLNLQTVHDRPPLLFVRGKPQPEVDRKAVAVVGTRQATEEGRKRAARLGRGLAERGVVVVSGLAKGIDTHAHQGALAGGGRTLAVIGTGITRAYPAENKGLQELIAHSGGAVYSQFWPASPPARQNFPQRNVTMSGMSLASIVVEAGPTSGAKMQAESALKHGHRVFLLPSLLQSHEWARTFSEKPNVHVLRNIDHVVELVEEMLACPTQNLFAVA